MDLFDAIDGRLTARSLGPPGPSPDQLDRILRAGVRAPDHGQLAPWRFVVLEGDDRAKLGDAMAALRRASEPDAPAAAIEAERNKAFRAPMVIVVAAEPRPHPKIPEIEQITAVAACVENMVLAARALGFCANWKTGPAAYDPGVKHALGLPPHAHIVAILYVGAPLGEQTPRQAVLRPK